MPESESPNPTIDGAREAKDLNGVNKVNDRKKNIWVKRFGRQIASAGILGLSLLPYSDGRSGSDNVLIEPVLISTPSPIGENITPVEGSIPQPIDNLSIPEYPRLPQDQKVLAVLARDSNARESIDIDKENLILERVSIFFKKSSYGKLNYEFQTVNWQLFEEDLDFKDPNRTWEVIDKRLDLLNEKQELPSDLSTYQTRLYVLDQSDTIAISGHGRAKEPYNQAMIYLDDNKDGEGGTIHELGHTLGLGHVDGYGCKHPNDYTNDCNVISAGGNSVMGSDYKNDIAGPQKLALGWIEPDQVKTVTEDTPEVKLNLLQHEDEGTKLLRIKKTDTGEYYYIEYANSNKSLTLNYYIWDQEKGSNLKRFAPAIGSYYSKDGSEFYDKINGIRVTQLAHDDGEVVVSVNFDK